MNRVYKISVRFFVIFLITVVLITLYLIVAFTEFKEPISINKIIKIVKQFGLIISIPTAFLFLGVDYLLLKWIKKKTRLNVVRCIAYFFILYTVCLLFSGYIIFNALLDSSLVE